MDMNMIIGFGAIAASASFIGCLIGFNIREKRHAQDNADARFHFGKEREALQSQINVLRTYGIEQDKKWVDSLEKLSEAEAFIKSLREQNRLLEQGMDQVVLERKQWEATHDDAVSKYSAQVLELKRWKDCVDTQLMIAHLWDEELHSSDPEAALAALLYWERSIALDPAVSKPAKNLIVKAKREHGKKLRAQHERLMQVMRDKANGYEELHRMAEEELVEAQRQLLVRQVALRNTCKDKLKLKGVRDSFKQAYWAEVSRLNSVQKETK